jgi:hypothetical protein
MGPVASSEPLRFHGISLSEAEIVERQDGRRVAAVPRAAIRSLQLEHGIVAERPLRQAAFALVMLVPGAFFGARLWWRWLTSPLPLAIPRFLLVAPVCFVVLGAWALRDAVRRGWFLRVETEDDARKLRISGEVDREALHAFADRLRTELRCEVREPRAP